MNRLTYIGLAIAAVFILTAIFAPVIATHDVTAQNLMMRYAAPSAAHLFGTDALGRDVFSRVVFGARISLEVGIIVVVVSSFIGIILGAVAGFYGGFVDKFLSGYIFQRFSRISRTASGDCFSRFSRRGLGKTHTRALHNRLGRLCSRDARASLKVREYDFVQAARALGASNFRILFTHILPNAIQPLIVQASLGMAGAVLSEASLSFLGLGIPPPAPSWGTMIEEVADSISLTTRRTFCFFPLWQSR
jgi:peptide/nickel transport system permease protein